MNAMGETAAHEIVVLIMIGRLPHFVHTTIVDPELVLILLRLRGLGQTGSRRGLEFRLVIARIEFAIHVMHFRADELAVFIFLDRQLHAIVAGDG